jgi:hypothetical protein
MSGRKPNAGWFGDGPDLCLIVTIGTEPHRGRVSRYHDAVIATVFGKHVVCDSVLDAQLTVEDLAIGELKVAVAALEGGAEP